MCLYIHGCVYLYTHNKYIYTVRKMQTFILYVISRDELLNSSTIEWTVCYMVIVLAMKYEPLVLVHFFKHVP